MWNEKGELIIGIDKTGLYNKELVLTEKQTYSIFKGVRKGIDFKLLIDTSLISHVKKIHIAEIIKKWGKY